MKPEPASLSPRGWVVQPPLLQPGIQPGPPPPAPSQGEGPPRSRDPHVPGTPGVPEASWQQRKELLTPNPRPAATPAPPKTAFGAAEGHLEPGLPTGSLLAPCAAAVISHRCPALISSRSRKTRGNLRVGSQPLSCRRRFLPPWHSPASRTDCLPRGKTTSASCRGVSLATPTLTPPPPLTSLHPPCGTG